MQFAQPLHEARLIKRYKRFLADVIHPEYGEMTVHCPNTGSMKNCWQEGWKVWLLDSENSKRKYRYTWVYSDNDNGAYIGINTHFANQLEYEGIVNGQVAELNGYHRIAREVKYGNENSRIDILLTDELSAKTYVEVKSVTLHEADGKGYFPDAKTLRGQKHLRELIDCRKHGHRAILFFLVQHNGIEQVSVAQSIDPDYAALLSQAIEVGVEILAYKCQLSTSEIRFGHRLDFIS